MYNKGEYKFLKKKRKKTTTTSVEIVCGFFWSKKEY